MGNAVNAVLTFIFFVGLSAIAICVVAVGGAALVTAVSYWLFGAKGLIVGGTISLIALLVGAFYVYRG